MSDDADLALLRAPTITSAHGATSGISIDLRPGTPIVMLGYPYLGPDTGGPSLSWGIVTATRRQITYPDGSQRSYLQTNYPNGRGASGAPVFDLRGALVGINAAHYPDLGEGSEPTNISLAVPSNS